MARKQTNTLVPTNSARFIKKIPTTECMFRTHFLVSSTCSLFCISVLVNVETAFC